MKNTKFKIMVRACSILTSIALLATFTTQTYAEDSIDTLENKTSNLQNELSGLNSELEKLSAELNSIMDKVKTTTTELEQTKIELADAKLKEESQYNAMKLRIKYIYENDNSSILEMLFSSGSMAEFLNKAEFVSTVSEYDRRHLEQLVETQNIVAEKEQQLLAQQDTLTSLQSELNQKEANLKSKISNTSGELKKYTDQLAEAKRRAKEAEEALRKKAEEEALRKKAEADALAKQNPSGGTPPAATIKPPVHASGSELELFAALIECEAGGSGYEGMLAVASVVMNRVHHRYYPNTITGVIYQSGQFAPVRQGKIDKVLKRGVKSSCLNVAKDAIGGKNNIGNLLNFRSASTGHAGTNIGGNVFF